MLVKNDRRTYQQNACQPGTVLYPTQIRRNHQNGSGGTGHDIVCDQGYHNDYSQNHQSKPPVEGQGHTNIRGKALAAPKLHGRGEDVSQNGGHTGYRADVGNVRINDIGQKHCQSGFSHIVQRHQRTGLYTHQNGGVGGAQVFAAT